MSFRALLLALFLATPVLAAEQDPFLWLEEVDSARSLDWVNQHNASSLGRLQSRATFAPIQSDLLAILNRTDRLPSISLHDGRIYTFWQDSQHPRGLWQRASVESYQSGAPAWEVLFDLDALDAAEGKPWVWKGANCLAPENRLCLISLSPGGGDAVEIREFDVATKAFVPGGFTLPVAKSEVSWADENTLLVGTDFGPGTMSRAGYPLVNKRWKRGTALEAAEEVFRGQADDMTVSSWVALQPGWQPEYRQRYLSFFEAELSLVMPDGTLARIPLPTDANLETTIGSKAFFTLHSELRVGTRTYASGALVAYPLLSVKEGARSLERLEVVFAPSAKRFLAGAFRSGNTLVLNVLDNVRGKMLRARRLGNGWGLTEIASIGGGLSEITQGNAFSEDFLATYMDFLTPTSQLVGNSRAATVNVLRASPAFFDGAGLVTEQFEATSKDGTKVPYFITHRASMPLDGKNPTLLYGYGGFNVSMTPWYSATIGKAWLERGGSFVVANIRGGGEFGPDWHEAARKEKHQNAFDDFISVAEDLVRRGFTTPAHLGIEGGSNGGLLMGAMLTQRPDLFRAVLCEVPLLDMMRYHLLLAGNSWIDEYGNPDVPAERDFILKYSPYQNVRAGMQYPEVFFTTSTHDDRVHPGHARKMAALLESMGYGVYFFENTEGGHGGSATPEQTARLKAMQYSYLWEKLAR